MPAPIDYKDPRYAESAGEMLRRQLAQPRRERSRVTVIIVRRELHESLRTSPEGRTVEEVVARLLRG